MEENFCFIAKKKKKFKQMIENFVFETIEKTNDYILNFLLHKLPHNLENYFASSKLRNSKDVHEKHS